MISIRYAAKQNKKFWFSVDRHASEPGFESKIRDRLGWVIFFDETPIGLLHCALLWDRLPFLNFIGVIPECRGRGYGSRAVALWEEEMRQSGFKMTLLSTQSDETAQHFYRKLGYKDCGCLILNDGPLAQPSEIFLSKTLHS